MDNNPDVAPHVLRSIPMEHGDVVALSPLLNTFTAHMVPKDPEIKDLRISLVFRHCDKRYVKLNEYHYDMELKGRGQKRIWSKGQFRPVRTRAMQGKVRSAIPMKCGASTGTFHRDFASNLSSVGASVVSASFPTMC